MEIGLFTMSHFLLEFLASVFRFLLFVFFFYLLNFFVCNMPPAIWCEKVYSIYTGFYDELSLTTTQSWGKYLPRQRLFWVHMKSVLVTISFVFAHLWLANGSFTVHVSVVLYCHMLLPSFCVQMFHCSFWLALSFPLNNSASAFFTQQFSSVRPLLCLFSIIFRVLNFFVTATRKLGKGQIGTCGFDLPYFLW